MMHVRPIDGTTTSARNSKACDHSGEQLGTGKRPRRNDGLSWLFRLVFTVSRFHFALAPPSLAVREERGTLHSALFLAASGSGGELRASWGPAAPATSTAFASSERHTVRARTELKYRQRTEIASLGGGRLVVLPSSNAQIS